MRWPMLLVMLAACDKSAAPPKQQPPPPPPPAPAVPDGMLAVPNNPKLVVKAPTDVKAMAYADNASAGFGSDDFAIVLSPATPAEAAETLDVAKHEIGTNKLVAAEAVADGWMVHYEWPDALEPKRVHDVVIVQRAVAGKTFRCTVTAFEKTRLPVLVEICTSLRSL